MAIGIVWVRIIVVQWSWVCPVCEREHDRDVNAAKNIMDQTTVGTMGSYASGVHVRSALVQTETKKPEAQQLAAG